MTWQPKTLQQTLAAAVVARGDSEAVVTQTARLSFRALAAEVDLLARAMFAAGLRQGDHVAILMGNDEHWISLFFAAASIGAVTVPVNTRFKPAEIAYALKQADVKALFHADRFLGIDFTAYLREAEPAIDRGLPGRSLPKLALVVTLGGPPSRAGMAWTAFRALAAKVDAAAFERAVAAVQPDDPLLIQFTSGTTAFPKGVLLTHANMLRNAWSSGLRIGIRAEDRYFNCRPFFHVGGSTLSLLMALSFGACLVTLPTFEAGAALRMLAAERCTLTSGNDTIFQMLMGHADFDRAKLHLRGGWAAALPQAMTQIIEVMGAKALCNAYGLSEASPNVVISDWRDPEDLRVGGWMLPHEGVQVRIADTANGAALPAGAAGEIQVRGWNVMRGYYNNPEATAKTFTADGWLKTGDLGEMNAEGRLRMLGRLKDVFRVGGENVAPAEVEDVLHAHPAVETAQVIGVPDPRLGEVPAAYVKLRADRTASEAELIAWVKARSANFRVPRYLRIVESFDSIGMTASGKVQKVKLREQAIRDFALEAEPAAAVKS